MLMSAIVASLTLVLLRKAMPTDYSHVIDYSHGGHLIISKLYLKLSYSKIVWLPIILKTVPAH